MVRHDHDMALNGAPPRAILIYAGTALPLLQFLELFTPGHPYAGSGSRTFDNYAADRSTLEIQPFEPDGFPKGTLVVRGKPLVTLAPGPDGSGFQIKVLQVTGQELLRPTTADAVGLVSGVGNPRVFG